MGEVLDIAVLGDPLVMVWIMWFGSTTVCVSAIGTE